MTGFKLNLVNNMRTKMLVPALLTAVFAAPAMANDQYRDTARVLSAVSYTHLDVYKRQGIWKARFRPPTILCA